MGLAATLLHHPIRVQRLQAALLERYPIVSCASWPELLDLCARAPVSLAVVDLFGIPGSDGLSASFDHLRALRRRFPSVAVVAYLSTPPARPRDLFEAGRFGLDGLVLADIDDDARSMRLLLQQAEARGVVEMVRRALGDVNPTVRDATLVTVTRAHMRLTPDSLAEILGIRRRALSDRLAQAGFPTGQRLIAWGRLIVAARMLEDTGRSADGVAAALGFPSGSAFRNTCQRYLRAAPHQIRAKGGSSYAIAAFLESCHRQPAMALDAWPARLQAVAV